MEISEQFLKLQQKNFSVYFPVDSEYFTGTYV